MFSCKNYLVSLLLIILIISVYHGSLNNTFVYDDYPFVVDNPSIKKITIESVLSYFNDASSIASNIEMAKDKWRPLTTLSFAIDYKLWGLEARYYHAENVLLHAANAVLLYALILLVMNNAKVAFITAAIFAVHPAQTESVAWISGRSNLLFLLFFLLSFLCHVRSRKRVNTSLNKGLSLIFFTLSLLSKEMALVAPMIFFLYDIYCRAEKSARRYIMYYLPYFLVEIFYVLVRVSVLGGFAGYKGWFSSAIIYSPALAPAAIARYLEILFWPVNLKAGHVINCPKSIFDFGILFVILALAAGIALSLVPKNRRIATFCMSWFLIGLLPVYNIVPFQMVIYHRFLYLSIIPFAFLFGVVFMALIKKCEKRLWIKCIVASIMAAVFLSYCLLSISRIAEWKDEVTFYLSETRRSTHEAATHYNLGFAYAKQARTSGNSQETAHSLYWLAKEEFEEALYFDPLCQKAYIDLGNLYDSLGMHDKAIKNFKKALAIKEDCDVYNNLGVAYCHNGMYDKAIACCKRALTLRPDHAYARINLVNAYALKKAGRVN